MPATIPVVAPTVATEVMELAHVPPVVVLFSVVVAFAHSEPVPVMAAGKGLIVTIAVLKHPPGNV
jgi:hypothetical protein